MASPGSVFFMFKKQGLIRVEKSANQDEQMLKIIDLGVQDVREDEDFIEAQAVPERLKEVKEKIEAAGFIVKGEELSMEPTTIVTVGDEQRAERILKFMETLEDHEDVQKVYANFDIPDEILAKTK